MNSNAAHYFSGEFDFADDASDSGADDEDATSDSLVLPALKYLIRCCVILTSMWRMPACPTFGTAQHIRAASRPLRASVETRGPFASPLQAVLPRKPSQPSSFLPKRWRETASLAMDPG